ncbi:helix-turn-helix domain-containing protein [Lachnospiraceae bacterium]|jgi:transcriptional regulator with XRE-family HTH domain|nr:helix-turn-helix domain-containing protein [Lachnospiraceae bacterium]
MDCTKVGKLIAHLRKEKGMTQKNLADAIGVLNKTVSKWECGLGCPDLSYWADLSSILGVENILVSTGSASIFCCGRKLERLNLVEKTEELGISIEETDIDYYITFNHPMEKKHYISFAAYVKNDRVLLNRLYPEQSPAFRIPINYGGKLYLYCVKDGLTVYSDLF